MNDLKNITNSKKKLSSDILIFRKMSQEQPKLRVDSGVSPNKSRTIELTFQDEMSSKSEKLSEINKNTHLKKSYEENVFYSTSFISGFEKLLSRIKLRVVKNVFDHLKNIPQKRMSPEKPILCDSEEQILKNIDNFLFKTRTHGEDKDNKLDNEKIESIQQLEVFEDVESLLRSALSKQISNKKSKKSDSKGQMSSQMNILVESIRNSRRSSKGLRFSLGSSIRGSGKSVNLQVSSPINAGQLMKELVFSKKKKNPNDTNKLNNEMNKQYRKEKGIKEDIKGEFIWNEASTKQSL